MTPTAPSEDSDCAPTGTRAPARVPHNRTTTRPLRLGAAIVALCLIAAACGGGDSSDGASAGSGAAPDETGAAASTFMATRPGAGIAAAMGNPRTVEGSNPCDAPDQDPIKIGYVGANLAELEAIGLQSLIIEEPGLVIDAYVDEVNYHGGINGRCVELLTYLWSLSDPVTSFTHICSDLPQQGVVFIFNLRADSTIVDCATAGAQVPTLGLYSSTSNSTLDRTGDRLYLDDGSISHLLANSLDIALQSGAISPGDSVGLLHSGGSGTESDLEAIQSAFNRHGMTLASTVTVPPAFSDLSILRFEKEVRLLETGLSDAEIDEAQKALAGLPPEVADLFQQMEQFYTETAASFSESAVTAVVASSDWSDVRRLMLAADRAEWFPEWITNDIQPATLTLTGAPRAQAENLFIVSARRAAGDDIARLDRGCITLRNTSAAAPTFSHRHHTDAWSLITTTCDFLDVAFSAMTRVQGPLTADSFAAEMSGTYYDTEYGALITFGSGDQNGWDRFRVLKADPDCVLNDWGCTRSTTEWLVPAAGAATG